MEKKKKKLTLILAKPTSQNFLLIITNAVTEI